MIIVIENDEERQKIAGQVVLDDLEDVDEVLVRQGENLPPCLTRLDKISLGHVSSVL